MMLPQHPRVDGLPCFRRLERKPHRRRCLSHSRRRQRSPTPSLTARHCLSETSRGIETTMHGAATLRDPRPCDQATTGYPHMPMPGHRRVPHGTPTLLRGMTRTGTPARVQMRTAGYRETIRRQASSLRGPPEGHVPPRLRGRVVRYLRRALAGRSIAYPGLPMWRRMGIYRTKTTGVGRGGGLTTVVGTRTGTGARCGETLIDPMKRTVITGQDRTGSLVAVVTTTTINHYLPVRLRDTMLLVLRATTPRVSASTKSTISFHHITPPLRSLCQVSDHQHLDSTPLCLC